MESHKGKTILFLDGPSCSGKSTVEAELGRRMPGTYTVAFDKLKWQLAGYDRDRDRETVKELLVGFFEVVCARGLPIILQVSMRTKEEFDAYARIAESHGYRIVSVRLTAPTETLLERFRARIANAGPNAKISVRDEPTFLSNVERPAYCPADTMVFDTTQRSAADVADQIVPLL